MGLKGRNSKGGKGTGAGWHVRSPSTQRELQAAQAATQLAQAATQAVQQQLQEVLTARVASVLLGRTASGQSLPIAARAQAATPTPPSPNRGHCGY